MIAVQIKKLLTYLRAIVAVSLPLTLRRTNLHDVYCDETEFVNLSDFVKRHIRV